MGSRKKSGRGALWALSPAERLALVERESTEILLSLQAELLRLSRSSLYYQPVVPSATEVARKHRIDEIYTAHPFYGSRRITAQLRREAVVINRKTIQQYMREMGIAGICPGPNLSRRDQAHKAFLTTEIHAWQLQRNQRAATVNWHFSTADARIKLRKLYPSNNA